ncbi:ArsR/SmtB family transcription factor [Janibacter cremeus]|uniref:DNA-binding transcriptional ArsR family regulator n=1 Tax=Janibacter cremeus TaxID=1285192 RepID=A0A852VU41_9MICO|nr:helix-turn-helix domain-containing protein [Janibacter cremeus]NYF98193.1 DNA-binding transcriptional ArsR family regulator [Janibacter cremeus]
MDPALPDVTQLKALSHPVRMRILGLLRTLGPATASLIARRLGLNSGATSYHLRRLAEHGFVQEAPGLGNKRERWWQAVSQVTSVPEPVDPDDEGRDATDAFHHVVVGQQAQRMQAAAERRGGESQPWRAVTSVSDVTVAVTAEQATQIQRRFEALLWEVIEEHGGPPGPVGEGERRFNVVVSTFVDTDEPAWGDGDA